MGIGNILAWILFGLVAGALARLFTPGRQPMGIGMTIVLGIVGSILGGLATWLLYGAPHGEYHPAGFIGSILGAVVVLLIAHRTQVGPYEYRQ